MQEFITIETREELARFLGVSVKELNYITYKANIESFYKKFYLPKKDGTKREIYASQGRLKDVQKRLEEALVEYNEQILAKKRTKTNTSHGFIKGKSIITNASIHRNKRFVINLDLQDFFPTLHFGRIVGYFEKNRDYCFPHAVAVYIARIVCIEGKLPQGAPTSPIISNLICQILDYRILSIAKRFKLDYSRYADDLTFSTNRKDFLRDYDSFINEITEEIEKAGFVVNQNKTRIEFRDSRQTVTGLVVNKKISVRREFIKETRAMTHSLLTKGSYTKDGIDVDLPHLEGRLSFIEQIEKYNRRNTEGIKGGKRDNLNGKERLYRDFLFYKYFFANEKPLIVTEGKTDIRYIKAALKKNYMSYPNLIERDEYGEFIFNVRFFRKSDKTKRFLGIAAEGADANKRIYELLIGDKSHPGYGKIISTDSIHVKGNPIILLYDNELSYDDKERPLYKFCKNTLKFDEATCEEIRTNLWTKIYDRIPLYLVTVPRYDGKNSSQIEDLFSQETKGTVLQGKKLSLDNKYDKEVNYGKNEFSQYIEHHYDRVDFSGFLPLLDAIDQIIKEK